MKYIEETLKYGVESNLITESKDQMFALYCIIELVAGNELTENEIKKATSLIDYYDLVGQESKKDTAIYH